MGYPAAVMNLSDHERSDWGSRIEQLREKAGEKITKWEEGFLSSIELQLEEGGWISFKQVEMFVSMETKYGIGGEDTSREPEY